MGQRHERRCCANHDWRAGGNTDANANRYSNSHIDSYSKCDTHGNANCHSNYDTDSYSDCNSNTNCNSNRDSDCNCYAYTQANADCQAECNAEASRNTGSSTLNVVVSNFTRSSYKIV